jgi:uncharacterized damage-inducible protein DinB
MTSTVEQPYPSGKFQYKGVADAAQREEFIATLANIPSELKKAVQGLSEEQLDTPYREGGWTLRQVVHHIADSSVNGYIRFKLAATEENPTIRPYNENRWSELPDAHYADIVPSIILTEALYKRWILFLRNLTEADFARTFMHPESGTNTLDKTLALYVWHGQHHLAHIVNFRQAKGW